MHNFNATSILNCAFDDPRFLHRRSENQFPANPFFSKPRLWIQVCLISKLLFWGWSLAQSTGNVKCKISCCSPAGKFCACLESLKGGFTATSSLLSIQLTYRMSTQPTLHGFFWLDAAESAAVRWHDLIGHIARVGPRSARAYTATAPRAPIRIGSHQHRRLLLGGENAKCRRGGKSKVAEKCLSQNGHRHTQC